MKILVIHGSNLNLLGKREPTIYGNMNLPNLNQKIQKKAQEIGIELEIFQSNSEANIVEKIHTVMECCDGIVINPAGLGYTSVSIKDALIAFTKPVVEVHLSNIHKRERFRQRTVISDICIGQISGFQSMSYILALEAINSIIKDKTENIQGD